MTAEEKEELEFKVLTRAMKKNHNIDSDSFSTTFSGVNPDEEIRKYLFPIEDIVQLTLPKRFGMYKTPKTYQKRDDEVELAEPEEEISPSYTPPEGHKTRPIFD